MVIKKQGCHTVFTEEQEAELKSRVVKLSKYGYGLTGVKILGKLKFIKFIEIILILFIKIN